jgi:outer membrane lipoprotein-sorting protein
MIKNFAIIIITLALTIMPANAMQRLLTPEETQLINEISIYNSNIKTMVGRFLQIDTNGSRVEGTFFLDRPNKIRFRYAPPSREEILSIGRGFYIIDRREETKYAYPQDQIPLRLFLEEKIDLLNANIVAVTSSTDFISISVADETMVGTVEVALIFDIVTKDLKQWTLTEPSGAQLTFSLYDVELNLEIPKSYFNIPVRYKAKNL